MRVSGAATGREVWAYTPAHSPPPNLLTMNPAGIQQVAFSPDGRRLAAALGSSQDPADSGEVKIWDAANGREVLTLKGHPGRLVGGLQPRRRAPGHVQLRPNGFQ